MQSCRQNSSKLRHVGPDLGLHVHSMASTWGSGAALGPASAQPDQLAPTWAQVGSHIAQLGSKLGTRLAVHVGANWSELGDSLGAGGTRREATRIFGLQYIRVQNCFGIICFSVFDVFWICFSPVLLAVCSILELEAAVSAVFAAFLNSNLWFSMEFATFCCSNCSCNLIVCNYRVHVGLVLGLV